ncbi:MAG TPA: DinB family protein [Cytophagaceae bacterium]
MNFIFEATARIRQNCLDAIKDLSIEQLHCIPKGFNNNIIWQLGHLPVTQQILVYIRTNQPIRIPEGLLPLFRKGTSPKEWNKPADLKEISELMKITAEAVKTDYEKGLFKNYEEYQTSSGLILRNVEDALLYNYGHENLHYGNILAMKKLL